VLLFPNASKDKSFDANDEKERKNEENTVLVAFAKLLSPHSYHRMW
jgi:hypothetical protein